MWKFCVDNSGELVKAFQYGLMLCHVEVKGELDSAHKKRKTEWSAGLTKLPGDPSLAKDRCNKTV